MFSKDTYEAIVDTMSSVDNVVCVGVEPAEPPSYQSFHSPPSAVRSGRCIRLGRWPRRVLVRRILLTLLMLAVYVVLPIVLLTVTPIKYVFRRLNWLGAAILLLIYLAIFTVVLVIVAFVILNLTRFCVWGAILTKACMSLCLYFYTALIKYTCLSWFRCDFKSGLSLTEVAERYFEHPFLEKDRARKEIAKNPFLSQILVGLNKKFAQFFFVVIPTGSLYEGFGKLMPHSSVLQSDYDILLSPSDADVALDEDNGQDTGRPTPFKAVASATPGYYWVQLRDERHKHFKPFCLKKYPSETETQFFLSSEILNEQLLDHLLEIPLAMPVDAGFPYKFQGKTIVPMSRYWNPTIAVKLDEPSLSTSVKAGIVNPIASLIRKFTDKAVVLSFSEKIFEADITFALPMPQWPDVAKKWLTREHPWLDDTDVIESVKSKGTYLVPKKRGSFLEEIVIGTEYSARPILEWALSFAPCELILMEHIPLKWKQVLILMKAALMRRRKRGFLRTFHVKTIFLWSLDSIQNPISYFDTTPLDKIFDTILGKLIESLQTRNLLDYWLDDLNLLDECVDCKTLDNDLDFFQQFQADPVMILARNALECQRCCQRRCFWPFRMTPPTSGGGGGVEEPCCYMACSYDPQRHKTCACPFEPNFLDAY